MQGNLILNADPTSNLGAATKGYVDNLKMKLIETINFNLSAGSYQDKFFSDRVMEEGYVLKDLVIKSHLGAVNTSGNARISLICRNNDEALLYQQFCYYFYQNQILEVYRLFPITDIGQSAGQNSVFYFNLADTNTKIRIPFNNGTLYFNNRLGIRIENSYSDTMNSYVSLYELENV